MLQRINHRARILHLQKVLPTACGAYQHRMRFIHATLGSWGMVKSGEIPDGEVRDKRQEERMFVTRPVRLYLGTGVTRNISESGVFFETNADYSLGSKIIFAIALDGPQGEKLELVCRGEIVRVERREGKMCVAAKIIASKLE